MTSLRMSLFVPFVALMLLSAALFAASAHASDTTPFVTTNGGISATPTLTLTASATTVASGGSTTLTWKTTNAARCAAAGDWGDVTATSSSRTISNITAAKTFTLTCYGAAATNTLTSGTVASVTKSVSVSVANGTIPLPSPTTNTVPTLSLTASPTSIQSGGATTISWKATNVTGCTASGGWSGLQATSGTKTFSGLTDTTTYTLSCKYVSDNGLLQSVSRSVKVAVTSITPPTLDLTASPTTVTAGDKTTLSWKSTNATSCTATGGWSGSKALNGTSSFTITAPQTYTLECKGAGGSVTKTVNVVLSASSKLTGSYPVYQGCEAPAETYARTIYIDPQTGSDTGDGSSAKPFKTFASAISLKKILAGDHVVLLPGDHGKVGSSKYTSPNLVGAKAWIWIDFQSGATVQKMDIRDMSRWIITKADVHPAGEVSTNETLLSTSAGSNIVIADSTIYTAKNANAWTAAQWIKADSGILTRNTTCVSIIRNTLTNIRYGILVTSDGTSSNPADHSLKTFVDSNKIKNFSGDGMRPIGSDVTFSNNSIIDEYVGEAEGDDNHDDGIQSFALNGAVYNNIIIDHNWVQESTDPSRAHNTELQGINSFSGHVSNVKITNNIVLSSAYHGISWTGITDTLIDHNTVINPTANKHRTWIYVPAGVNVTVSNNTATRIMGTTTGVTYKNNYEVPVPADAYTTIDLVKNIFDLHPKKGSIIDGKNAGASWSNPIATATPASKALGMATSLLASALSAWDAFITWLSTLLHF